MHAHLSLPQLVAILLACATGSGGCCLIPGPDRCGPARDDARRAWAAYELDLQQRASIVATQLQLAEAANAEVTRLDARYNVLDPSKPFLFFGCPSASGQPVPAPSPALREVVDGMRRERERACDAHELIAQTAETRLNPGEGFNLDLQFGPGILRCAEDHRGMSASCTNDSKRIAGEFAELRRTTHELRVNVDSGTTPETLLQMSRTGRVERTENPLRTAAVTSLETLRDRCR